MPPRKGKRKQRDEGDFTPFPPCLPNDTSNDTSPEGSRLWIQGFAATATAKKCPFPSNTARLLGTITRALSISSEGAHAQSSDTDAITIDEIEGLPVLEKSKEVLKRPEISSRRALKEAQTELSRGFLSEDANDDDIHARAQQIARQWDEANPRMFQHKPVWDRDGHVPIRPGTQSLRSLAAWLNKNESILQDSHADAVVPMAPGVQIPVDTFSVVEACQSMSDPSVLWRVPLLICPVQMQTRIQSNPKQPPRHRENSKHNIVTTYQIQIGVYAHRMLSEATTLLLRTVMAALDQHSYHLERPLSRIPPPARPTFASSPFPKVSFDDNDDDDDDEFDDHHRNAPIVIDSDDDRKPAAKNGTKRQDVVLMENSTRNDDTVSAFSTSGLLKLLESPGCDISEWPAIQENLQHSLRLSLMAHQRHAVCWMHQMERVDVNSLFWETRHFAHGIPYYYAPALGQLRFESPYTDTRGGLLCDEMGLGKTIMMVALILSTLQQLKDKVASANEQRRNGSNNSEYSLHHQTTHATLIIVPPALVEQWRAEIIKCAGDALQIDVLESAGRTVRWRFGHENPDVCICSYPLLLSRNATPITAIAWGRVVLDEMQEVRGATRISKACEKLISPLRWMLSGTPLFEGISDFKYELNFLGLEPFSATTEDGFFRLAVEAPWESHDPFAIEMLRALGQVVLRRSKSMAFVESGEPILGLKPLVVEFVPVVPNASERALYYFLEYAVAQALDVKQERENDELSSRWQSKQKNSRRLYLTLLRDMCTSAVLINGGIGVATQLDRLNAILVNNARKNNRNPVATDGHDTVELRELSCDEAILHLAQAQEATRTQDDDQVAMMQLGFGGGLARRARAAESVESQLAEAETNLATSRKKKRVAVRAKTKALWHLAMEKVTCGFLPTPLMASVKAEVKAKWMQRERKSRCTGEHAADVFRQVHIGWRPTRHYFVEYFWGHSNCFTIERVPDELSGTIIALALAEALQDEGDHFDDYKDWFCEVNTVLDMYSFDKVRFCVVPFGQLTSLGVVFKNRNDAAKIARAASRVGGIRYVPEITVKSVQKRIDGAKEELKEARALLAFHPSKVNRKRESVARKELKDAEAGVSIVLAGSTQRESDIVLSPAVPNFRSGRTKSGEILPELYSVLETSNLDISTALVTENENFKTVLRLESAAKNVDADVRALSSFDTLQALSEGRLDDTQCSICLGHLGSAGECYEDSLCNLCRKSPSSLAGTIRHENSITLTKCGHLYCTKCFKQWCGSNLSMACVVCRKKMDTQKDLVLVNPAKQRLDTEIEQEKRSQAKKLVEGLCKKLEESDGVLGPELWQQLYHSIDVPSGVSVQRDIRVSALPRDLLAHLGTATGLPVACSASTPLQSVESLSSKVRVLLRDLPKAERSVVFSSSRRTIAHLRQVFEASQVGHRALFMGQAPDASQQAIQEWLTTDGKSLPYPVLLVQAGAAASGITLTAACKMFLMEPFIRYGEEQQAYARCHRYGQTKATVCKCYYAPVSVESRLLEWRKRANDQATTATKGSEACIVYTSKLEVGSDDESCDSATTDEQREISQTKFLLGLTGDKDSCAE